MALACRRIGFSSDDRELNLRRAEYWAWCSLADQMGKLADTPLSSEFALKLRRRQVEKSKAIWARALQDLDGVP